jgi:hypothetical protein
MPLWLDNSLPDLVTYAQLFLRSALLLRPNANYSAKLQYVRALFWRAGRGASQDPPRKVQRGPLATRVGESPIAPAVVRPLSQSSSNIPALIRFKLEVAIDYLPYGYLLLPSSAFPGGIQEY